MKLASLLIIFALALCVRGQDVDEDFLNPHREDVVGLSDHEILEDLEEEIHASHTSEVTTKKEATKKPACPKFGPSLTKLLRSYGFSVKKLRERCYTVAQARRFIRVQLARRERIRMRELRQREREEKLEAIRRRAKLRKERAEKKKLAAQLRAEKRRRKREERRRRRLEALKREKERRRRAKEEAARKAAEAKAADYIPMNLKKLLAHFGYDWKAMEKDHVAIPAIQKELSVDAAHEASDIVKTYHKSVKEASTQVTGEYSKYMTDPLKEIRRVSAMEKKVVEDSEKAKEQAQKLALRVRDAVKRRSNRLRLQLLKKEHAIQDEAIKEEKEAELAAITAAKKLKAKATQIVLKGSARAQNKKLEADRVIHAANSWFQDQELPAIQRLSDLEQKKLAAKLTDIQTESRFKLLNLRHILHSSEQEQQVEEEAVQQ